MANALEEVVNFGSHIFSWKSSKKLEGELNIPPSMLFRHYLDIVDSISLLVRQGSGDTSKILARALLETSFYLEYILEKDTDIRASAFLVVDTIDQIKSLKKFVSTNSESKKLYETFKNEEFFTGTKFEEHFEIDKMIKTKEAILELPILKKAYKEYQKCTRNGDKEIKWYHLFNGPKNIYLLSKYLKKATMYEIMYRKWSGATHGSDIYLGKMTSSPDGSINIVQLRYPKDIQEIVKSTLLLSVSVFWIYINNLMPEKRGEMLKWQLSFKPTLNAIVDETLLIVE